jgi:uncharacterized protein (DUF305 family)
MTNAVPNPQRSRALRLFVLAGSVALILTVAALIFIRSRAPADDSAEAGFARDMATHHAQAVEMAFIVRDASTDQRLRAFAYDIIVTQATQRGVFMGWLQQWGLPQASARPRMAWMPGHATAPPVDSSGTARLMHGMATDDELARLRRATGVDAEILFLQLMIRHHEGGVLMARAVIALTRRDEVETMARSIDSGQSAEIALMNQMLADRTAAGK